MLVSDPSLYYPVYIYSLLFLTIGYTVSISKYGTSFIQRNTNQPLVLIYIFLFVLLVGLRPISGYYFGDTSNYAQSYNLFVNGILLYNPDSSEWLFEWLMYQCSQVMNVHSFFLLIEILYVIPVLWACKKLVSNHALLMFLVCMGAFSFFTYGTNGIRNGMACSLIIAALTCVHGNLFQKIIGGVLAFLAFNIHRSTALPIVCILTTFLVKDTRLIIGWWITSIFLSLVAGGTIEAFFTGLGFDDRLSSYATDDSADAMFSSTGFRWDFLLYSAMPILLGYYVVIKRKIWDKNYLLLLHTYILCNSFWVMMIRASYSNRFAYLSWFLYALVLIYPCLKLPIWRNQGKKTALIILGHLGFTLFMYLIY